MPILNHPIKPLNPIEENNHQNDWLEIIEKCNRIDSLVEKNAQPIDDTWY